MIALPRRPAGAAVLLCTACGAEEAAPAARPPSVLLVTLDTCRADRLHCYGNDRVETPNLDTLAREGTRFAAAFTPVPSTLPSHCTILTGQYPGTHGVHDNGVYALPDEAVTLAEHLREAGYATAAFVSAFVLDAQFNLAQGFETYDDEVTLPLAAGDPARLPDTLPEGQRRWFSQLATAYQRRAEDVTPRAQEWLRQYGGRPFFLWVHYFDAHAPYQAPEPWTRRYDPGYAGAMDGSTETFHRTARQCAAGGRPLPPGDVPHMVARYDGEISYLDAWVGELLGTLRELGRDAETLVVVVGDHGESFGEHRNQIFEHNGDVYDEVVRVPLIVRRGDRRGAGGVAEGIVRTLDVAPTILEWAGLPADGVQGVSLLPLVADPGAAAPGEVLLEARRQRQIFPPERSFLALRTDAFKAVLALDGDAVLDVELYDLGTDPGERGSVADADAVRTAALRDRVLALHEAALRAVEAGRDLDALASEALEALGYGGR